MSILKKIISFLLVIAIVFSFVVPVSATNTSGSDLIMDTSAVEAWSLWLEGNLGVDIDFVNLKSSFWKVFDRGIAASGAGSLETLGALSTACTNWNSAVRSGNTLFGSLFNSFLTLFKLGIPYAEIAYDTSLGLYRLRESDTGFWLVNSSGHFPYYDPDDDSITEDSDITQQLTYQWIRGSQVNWDGGKAIVSYTELKDILGLGYDGYLKQRNQYLHIYDSTGTQILCTEEGYPLSAIADMQSTAVGTPNNYYTDEGDTVNNITNIDQGDTTNNQFIDITDNSVWFPDGTLQYIDKLYYDESTKTYYVDSHDSYVYSPTTNTYITNNYRYEYNYYIDYTSVTYIGQTEEYDEEYRFYYELPDGRSSADLTAEDLEQLSLVFDDVIQYSRTADNIDQRALYHFDGNTEDSSYWSYASDFDWSSGASLTYMDEGTFNGSLYLDETEHDFTITLPNNDAAGDWTLQFRYYQSYTAAPVTDSYLKVGEHIVLQFTGAQYLYGSGAALAATSIGTWNEICLIRSNGVLYYYINGVYYGSASDAVYHNKTINFHFGSEQQTYKKLDELRFTSAVIYSPGQDYTPSAVPFDSNLTLVLPDNGTLEEQGLQLVPSENNLLTAVGLDDWTSLDVVENIFTDCYAFAQGNGADGHYFPDPNQGPSLVLGHVLSTSAFTQGDNFVRFDFRNIYSYGNNRDSSGVIRRSPGFGLFVPVVYCDSDDWTLTDRNAGGYGFEPDKTYTFSVVQSDGSYSYATFRVPYGAVDQSLIEVLRKGYSSNIVFDFSYCGYFSGGDENTSIDRLYGFMLYTPRASDCIAEIVYMELVEGIQPEFQFTKTYSTFVEDPEPVEVIPDEFTTITKPVIPSNLLESKNLDDWTDDSVTGYLTPFSGSGSVVTSIPVGSMSLVYNSSKVTFSDGGSFTTVNFGGNTVSSKNSDGITNPINSLFFPVFRNQITNRAEYYSDMCGLTDLAPYTLSVVLADGSYSTVTFRTAEDGFYSGNPIRKLEILSKDINSVVLFGDSLTCGQPRLIVENDSAFFYNFVGIPIYLSEGTSADILYMELIEGTETQFTAGRHTSIYTAADLSGAPILAVRTNRTITGYQFGGVRPSYPEKGQIWAMVEGGRIRSLQQYTGSAWVEVDGRIWTGERWIPYSSYDVFLLKDCYDILGTVSDPDYEYIYSEAGFWAWWQKQWLSFKDGLFGKLDAIIAALEELTGLEISDETGCQHVYTMETYDANCSDPGHTIYTCTECEHTFTESIDALGHDWIVEEDVPNTYKMPDGAYCPGCTGTDFTFVINASQDEYTCTCTTCSTEWTETPEVIYGYTLSTCSRCGKTQKDSKDPESGIFDALGNFLADGVEWVTDKLTQAVNGLNDMLTVFQEYAESMKEKVGEYPAFLTAVIAVMPQDLMDVFWFGLVALLVVIAWKKLSS